MHFRTANSLPALPEYRLGNELARLCLPSAQRESHRVLAWTNSICALFLLIGLTGLRPSAPRTASPPPARVPVPVFIHLQEEPPLQTAAPSAALPPTTSDVAFETPRVMPVVVADALPVTAAITATEPVRLAPAQSVAPAAIMADPSPVAASIPTRYVPSDEDWGGRRQPDYPSLALRRGYQGTVTLAVVFDAAGVLTTAQVHNSSGHRILDEAALEHVQRNLRLRNPPGEIRRHLLDIIFQLR